MFANALGRALTLVRAYLLAASIGRGGSGRGYEATHCLGEVAVRSRVLVDQSRKLVVWSPPKGPPAQIGAMRTRRRDHSRGTRKTQQESAAQRPGSDFRA